MSFLKFNEYAKAYVALVGSIATAVLGVVGPETPTGSILVIVAAVCTAVGTWAVPAPAYNTADPAPGQD